MLPSIFAGDSYHEELPSLGPAEVFQKGKVLCFSLLLLVNINSIGIIK